MKKNNLYIIVLAICFTILSVGVDASEVAPKTIKIDSNAKALIAPKSSSYKWYYNGQKLAFTEREVKITSPGTYEVETVDEQGVTSISKIQVALNATGSVIQIFTIGDSTVANYGSSEYPWAGWGQLLKYFFDSNKVAVSNRAKGGRSSRTYYQEGSWASVKAELTSGSYVFVQFGHNDRDFSTPARYTTPDSMKVYLRIYVNESRAKGAIPVLVSPMSMNTGTRNVFTESGNDYRGAMLAVATELNVPFLDLNTRSYNFYQQIGTDYASYFIHMGLLAGEYSNYPSGYTDTYTHYQEMGALAMARMVTQEITANQTNAELAPLAAALKPLYNVSVALKTPSAGVATISGDYPEGVTVTLKSRLTGSRTLKNWTDSINKITLNGNLVTFTMAPHAYNFVGNVGDCFGTVNGTATIDGCGVCTGGETKLNPCTSSIKFSDFCETNTNLQISLDNAPYNLYLKTDSVDNAYLTQQLNVAKTDSFLFAISYNNPSSSTKLNIYVNDTLNVSNLALSNGSTWNVAKFYLHLSKGQKAIKIKPVSQSGGILLNYLALYSQDITKIACTPSTDTKTGNYIQKDSLIVLEAENYNKSKPAKNGTKWRKALFNNASNGKVVISPVGTSYATAATALTDAPVLSYNVDFPYTGNYSVWARVYAFDGTGDSYHLGLDGKVLLEKIDLYNSTKVYNSYTWMHVTGSNLTVSKTGIQSLDLYCREPNLIIDKLLLTLNSTYAATGSGPAQTMNPTNAISAGINNTLMNNQDVQLSVYPNPAQDQIKISYNLPENNRVNISILNLNGQLVTNIISEYQVEGTHELNWNLTNTKSNIHQGLYLIKIQTGNLIKIQKLLVIQ
jgi:lysophospholipase L1-like esterase